MTSARTACGLLWICVWLNGGAVALFGGAQQLLENLSGVSGPFAALIKEKVTN
jgi:hypothetical protein